ncbi:ropporin-1-like protein [Sardina pilchardus]|uniref:ropporin-1-like protein n=1 Tax=Sardina pilchardus TaxID=27697 RepID=UPI002E118910
MSQSRDVFIPDTLPEFLKQYTKDVIRTQPEDLLQWSHKYFTSLVKGQPLPVGQPSDRHLLQAVRNLTPEVLRGLHSQFHKQRMVSQKDIMLAWKSLSLAENCLSEAFMLGHFGEEVEWMKFFTLCCHHLGGNIRQALVQACYILNSDPQCQPPDACVPFDMFKSLYFYLVHVTHKLTRKQAEKTLTVLQQQTHNGVVKVSDFINDYKLILDPTQ